ncbi:hypothetical protein Ddye_010357 [Dipteronia dyeriana]|uniref:Uncharacterized protein n=1 Tax=Dipteronia dyeriana TaxID=168575 RepID=A0AAD9XDC3_9ROSI|nr:hypothetical protein Ddye_010357 [Dipteronia dyeriana]
MGFMELAQSVVYTEQASSVSSARTIFQWGGTISALFLLLLNRTGRRSHIQTTLLVLYLFTSFPTVLFKILRGQFGRWVAFLAVGANLFFPRTIPASRFILFVITPEWLANGLRDDIVGGFFCLIIGVLLVIAEIRLIITESEASRGSRNWECTFCHCFGYCFGIAFLLFFTILYLWKGI